jgi:hypothetical protein
MNGLRKNQIAMLLALIVMMLIAATFGYRLQISASGLIFERGAGNNSTSGHQANRAD